MVAQPLNTDFDDEPPATRAQALPFSFAGLACIILAMVWVFASGGSTHGFDRNNSDGFRMILVVIGFILVGTGIAYRPRDGVCWLVFAACGFLSYGFGTAMPAETAWMTWKPDRRWFAAIPNGWDSFQIVGAVFGGIGLVGACFTLMNKKAISACIFAITVFYSTGILASVLSPPATPFLVDQYWRRVSRFHSQFLYINNAYHFYSPEPGPPSELWICIKYKPEGEEMPLSEGPITTNDYEWFKIPTRLRDTMDPLRLSYYRRLALVEQAAQMATSPNSYFPEELQQVNARRLSEIQRIPKDPSMADSAQYLQPNDQVIRQVLPSFANHFAKRYGHPDKEVLSVRIYRVLHENLPVEKFRMMPYPSTAQRRPKRFSWEPTEEKPDQYRLEAFSPQTYHPYYQGEYDMKGNLLDPQDPLLYWIVPIVLKPSDKPNTVPITKANFDKFMIDYVSIHAGLERPKE